ncbi:MULTISPECIES: ABC transporter permease [Bosea]|uniref:ABC transporter permease n=1 Tax=Bosea TaxID=85413 RepID=UPI00215054C9|nr:MULTISPECIES: ABC transporter permease [Bosea]MCR4523954.1 ABC transporter permease [Bosea sp. 47.2.35]MDR6830614.1 peptide/nickel transport system permease protein [Bosea robiniae]MDR6897495.1 peptide/nickel transport system permease protein [Bosea sp. BE109]MDR7140892.1 peptide/nickel transport system permease protein [Bosea sp. BE168]MDR7177365.1 peptide/nickel transport system permease protein [Bosea sp. BE271]
MSIADATLVPTAKRAWLTPARALGLGLLGLLVLFALLGPLLVTVDPNDQDFAASLASPGADYWLGADHYGRSMLARLSHGARLSFGMALLTVATAAVPGILLGLLAAWSGGWLERILELVSTVLLALPGLLLVLILLAFAPGTFGPLYLGLALTLWIEFYRVTRVTAAGVLKQPHVEAARLLGFGTGYVLRSLVLPEIRPILITLAAFAMSTAIIAISTLSAISVGLRPPTPELGAMIVELLPYYAEAPLHVLMPGILIFLLVLGLQLATRSNLR